MATYILVDTSGNVVNSVVWDGTSPWQPPAGLRAVAYNGVWRDGWRWDGTKAYDPDPPPPPQLPSAAPAAPTPSAGIKTI